MINHDAEINASAAIEQIEALAGIPLGAAERAYLEARPGLYTHLVGTLEVARSEFTDERFSFSVELDPDEATETLAIDIWLPSSTECSASLAKDERFGDVWIASGHCVVPDLSVGIRFE